MRLPGVLHAFSKNPKIFHNFFQRIAIQSAVNFQPMIRHIDSGALNALKPHQHPAKPFSTFPAVHMRLTGLARQIGNRKCMFHIFSPASIEKRTTLLPKRAWGFPLGFAKYIDSTTKKSPGQALCFWE